MTELRRLGIGIGIAVVYLLTMGLTFLGIPMPARPLYDGFGPTLPYYWVRVPEDEEDLPQFREGAVGGGGTVRFTFRGSEPASVATPDGQAVLSIPEGAILPSSYETAVEVIITPLDWSELPPPPRGTRLNGNAYLIEMRYAGSQLPAVIGRPVTIILRYPTFATQVFRLTNSGWTPLKTNASPASLQVYAGSTILTTFVAGAPRGARPPITRRALPFVVMETILAIAIICIVVLSIHERLRSKRP